MDITRILIQWRMDLEVGKTFAVQRRTAVDDDTGASVQLPGAERALDPDGDAAKAFAVADALGQQELNAATPDKPVVSAAEPAVQE